MLAANIMPSTYPSTYSRLLPAAWFSVTVLCTDSSSWECASTHSSWGSLTGLTHIAGPDAVATIRQPGGGFEGSLGGPCRTLPRADGLRCGARRFRRREVSDVGPLGRTCAERSCRCMVIKASMIRTGRGVTPLQFSHQIPSTSWRLCRPGQGPSPRRSRSAGLPASVDKCVRMDRTWRSGSSRRQREALLRGRLVRNSP